MSLRSFRHPTPVALLLIALCAATSPALGATYSVTNAANSGAGSLRAAINAANGSAGADTIQFAIGGSGPHTITLLTVLPAILETVTIDGTTQSGYAGTPRIVIAGAGLVGDGLTINAANVTLKAISIGGFSGRGISANGNGLRVELCHIGVSADGASAAANTGAGIVMSNVANAVIGPGNVISANGVDGLRIDGAAATGNVVKGNRIGTNRDGTAALGNAVNGVVLNNLASANTIGGTTAADLNLISGNLKNGIAIIGGASNNLIARNYVGLAIDGNAVLGNGEDGVLVIDSPANRIGGDLGGTFNVISGNAHHGVELRGDDADNNIVQRSVIGLDVFGTLDRGNGRAGVYQSIGTDPSGGDGNVIGGGAWNAGGNLISGNTWAGVLLQSGNDLLIQGNRIGTDLNGGVALANSGGGIEITDGYAVTVGSTSAGNLISGNGESGIDVIDGSLVSIVGNRIGTDANGTAALPNSGRGVWIRDALAAAVIGGSDHDAWTCNRACNLISGNTGAGIQLGPSQFDPHRVLGNFIGSNLAGTAALPNASGITSNTYAEIGGALAGEGNLISGNNGFGISGDGVILRIFGNRIGTTANGTTALANTSDGVRLGPDRVNLELGGATAGHRNVIAGNGGDGIEFLENDPFESANQAVQGNYIGVAADGSTCLGNAGSGLRQSGSEFMLIGGSAAGEGNRIGCNGGDGYAATSSVHGVGLLGNLFFSNGGLAIDLGDDGVTPNDPGDGDVWLDNFPVLDSALLVGATTTISGALEGAPSLNYRVEFFSSAACDSSGHGEGRNLVAATSLSTNAAGAASFSVPVTGQVAGQVITATATVVSGSAPFVNYSTSEFSACTTVRTPLATLTMANATAGVAEAAGSIALMVLRSGDTGHAVSVNYSTANGSANAGSDYTSASGTLNFAANETQKTLNIAIANDALDEDAETFTLTLSGAGAGAQVGSPAAATITINDDDNAPTLAVDNSGCTVSEGNAGNVNCGFVLRLSAASGKTVTFNTSTTGVTATAGTDFTGHASTARSIASGQTTLTVNVPVIGDVRDENNETFTLNVASVQNASPGSLGATGTINDDDAAPTATLDACTVIERTQQASVCSTRLRLSAVSNLEASAVIGVVPKDAVVYTSFETPAIPGSVQSLASGQSIEGWAVESGSVDIVKETLWLTVDGQQSLDMNGSAPGTLLRNVTTANGVAHELWLAKAANPGCGAGIKSAQVLLAAQNLGLIEHQAFAPPNYEDLGWAYQRFAITGNGAARALRIAGLNAGACGITLDHVALLAAGNAMPHVDLVGQDHDVVIAPGQTVSDPILIEIVADADIEPDELFQILARSTSHIGTVTAATGTILNDDFAPEIFANGFE